MTTVSATSLHLQPTSNEIYDEAVELALLPADVICACRSGRQLAVDWDDGAADTAVQIREIAVHGAEPNACME